MGKLLSRQNSILEMPKEKDLIGEEIDPSPSTISANRPGGLYNEKYARRSCVWWLHIHPLDGTAS